MRAASVSPRVVRPVPVLLLVAVGVLATAVRFGLLWRSGLLNVGNYDDGVHYAVAVNLVHGRLPYRDVLFLQPPGIALAATPFAALAPLIGDPRAFILAKLAFVLVGGLNAVLVAAVLRRFGTPAAIVGGVLYAMSFPAVYDERTITLEPPATTAVLVALLLLPLAQERASGRLFLLAGLAAGTAIGFKIWYVVGFAVLLVAARGGRLRFLVGGAIAGLAIYLPFFVTAPVRMWQLVVLAQLGRPDLPGNPVDKRLRSMLGISGLEGSTPVRGVDPQLLLLLLGAVAVALVAVALLDRRARVFVALLAVFLTVLLVSPSYFQHYSALVASPLALVAGAATARLLPLVPGGRLPRAALVALLVVAAVGLNQRHDGGTVGVRPPLDGLQAAAARIPGCVISDDPGLLAGMDVLTRDVANGCGIQPDPSGVSYADARYTIDGVPVDRDRNPPFQREITRYLLSGSAHIVIRQDALLLQPPAEAALTQGVPVFSDRVGGQDFDLYRTGP